MINAEGNGANDARDIEAFLRAYAMAYWDGTVAPPKPITLQRDGRHALAMPTDELREIVGLYEAQGFLMAPRPVRESRRLATFKRYGLPHNALNNPALSRITRLAASMARRPSTYAIINLIDVDNFFIVADSRSEAQDTIPVPAGTQDALTCSLCTHTVLRVDGSPMTITDTAKDWRFAKNPWCTEVIGAYWGMPILVEADPDGDLFPREVAVDEASRTEVIGVLCLYDAEPGKLVEDRKLPLFRDLCALASSEIEAQYAVEHRKHEVAMRLSATELLDSVPTRDAEGNWRHLLVHLAPSIPVDRRTDHSVDVFQAACHHLKRYLEADAVALINMSSDIGVADAHARPTVLGTGGDTAMADAMAKLSSSNLVTFGAEVDAAQHHHTATKTANKTIPFLSIHTGLPALHKIFDHRTSLNVLPITEVSSGTKLLVVVGYKGAGVVVAPPEQSYARLLGAILIGQLRSQQLLATSEGQTTFISHVSHELRTPLYGLLSQLESMRDICPPAALTTLTDAFDTAEVCGLALRDILNNLLDLQKTRFGRGDDLSGAEDSKQLEEHDLSFFLANVVRIILSQQARRENIDSHSTTPRLAPSADVPAICPVQLSYNPAHDWRLNLLDSSGLQRVILNIVGNAIKYTPSDGRVDVTLGFDGEETVVIEVADTGRGMSPDFQRMGLWQPFVQASRWTSGAGLGMAISRAIMERMNGSIEVESKLGVGSTEPKSKDSPLIGRMKRTSISASTGKRVDTVETSPAILQSPAPLPAANALRVLLVDDNPVALRVLTKVCTQAGIEHNEAVNGVEALGLFTSFRPHLVLTDLEMPLLDGLGLAKRIRQLERDEGNDKACHIIVISAATSQWPTPEIDEWLIKGEFKLQDVGALLREMKEAR